MIFLLKYIDVDSYIIQKNVKISTITRLTKTHRFSTLQFTNLKADWINKGIMLYNISLLYRWLTIWLKRTFRLLSLYCMSYRNFRMAPAKIIHKYKRESFQSQYHSLSDSFAAISNHSANSADKT